jgi:hypothetical protein
MTIRVPDSMLVNPGGNMKLVSSIAALKAMNPSIYTLAWIQSGNPITGGLFGTFVWTLGDFTARVAADTVNGMFVESDLIDASIGAWVRITNGGEWHTTWFDPGADASPALTAMINVANIVGPRKINVDGFYTLNSELPYILSHTKIDGGLWYTNGFSKNYSPSASYLGVLSYDTVAPYVENITILATSGTPCAGISLAPNANISLQKVPTLHNIHISGQSFLNNGIFMNGSAITSGAVGIRAPECSKLHLFGVASGGSQLSLTDVKHGEFEGVWCHSAGGANADALIIDGGAAGGSGDLEISGMFDGNISVSNCSGTHIKGRTSGFGTGPGNITFFGTANAVTHVGDCSGTVTGAGVNGNSSLDYSGVAN